MSFQNSPPELRRGERGQFGLDLGSVGDESFPMVIGFFRRALMGCFILVCILSRAGEQPNILFILADDVGREVLGAYGGTSYQTPRLDRLASEGTRFRHAYVMAVCHPTRVSLLTGRYPFQLGKPKWGGFPKAEEKRTFPWSLKRAGYTTAIAGKWQLTLLKDDPKHPHRLGFDEYSVFGWHEGPRYWLVGYERI